eukprot:9402193-Pyramimonas_sp.AAC.1
MRWRAGPQISAAIKSTLMRMPCCFGVPIERKAGPLSLRSGVFSWGLIGGALKQPSRTASPRQKETPSWNALSLAGSNWGFVRSASRRAVFASRRAGAQLEHRRRFQDSWLQARYR